MKAATSSLPEQNLFHQQPGFSVAVAEHPAALIHRTPTQPRGAQEGRMRASERSEVSGR
jgi:hypothetical protein